MSKASIQGEKNQNIKVYVRCRPINEQERKARSAMCVDILETRRAVTVKSHHDKTFTFDGTFGRESSQIEVYKTVVQPLIAEVLQGYNCTVFAYGQTGTGKTYTMEGVRSEQLLSWQHDPHAGIVPRALHQIFSEAGDPGLTIIKVSFLELYNEELFDLLGSGEYNAKLKIFEDASAKGSVVVRGLEEVVVRDRQEVYTLMERGASRRQVAATLMNASSSRSHTIFTITVISKDTTDTGEGLMRTGKLNLVDLAGSENIGRSGAQDKRAREAGNINQSLLTLGRVITALVERTPHVPYRESKLTRLLQDSLGGRTKTSIIATISPAQVNIEETQSTLEYAFRAKNITNRPEVNQKLCKEVVLKHMTDELEQLRRDLIACREKNGFYIDETNYREMQNRLDLQSEELQKKAQEMTDMAERIDLLKTQISEVMHLFEDTQRNLEIKAREMNRVQNRLKEVNFNYTGAKVVIKAHEVTEEKLHEDASKMMRSLKMASTDANLLHDKVRRQSDIAQQNSAVIEKLMGILSASLDSSSRGVEDALLSLSVANSVQQNALQHFTTEGRLITEADSVVAQIVEHQERRRAEFVANMAEIERRATDAAACLPTRSETLVGGLRDILQQARMAIAGHVVDEVKALRKEAESGLEHLTKTLHNYKTSALMVQDGVGRELTQLECEGTEISKRTMDAVVNSKALLVNSCDRLDGLMHEFDLLKSKVVTAVQDIRKLPSVQNEIGCGVEDISNKITQRKLVISEMMSQYVTAASSASDTGVEKACALKNNVVNHENSVETLARNCTAQMDSDINACIQRMTTAFEQSMKEVTELKTRVAAESMRMERIALPERKNMARLCEQLIESSTHMETTRQKLHELKVEALKMLQENVQTCTPTGSTPVKRNYDAPLKVASTQPAALLLNRLQARYEQATSEERMLLDEGHSILLDVSASPEMLALCDESPDTDDGQDKENMVLGCE